MRTRVVRSVASLLHPLIPPPLSVLVPAVPCLCGQDLHPHRKEPVKLVGPAASVGVSTTTDVLLGKGKEAGGPPRHLRRLSM